MGAAPCGVGGGVHPGSRVSGGPPGSPSGPSHPLPRPPGAADSPVRAIRHADLGRKGEYEYLRLFGSPRAAGSSCGRGPRPAARFGTGAEGRSAVMNYPMLQTFLDIMWFFLWILWIF